MINELALGTFRVLPNEIITAILSDLSMRELLNFLESSASLNKHFRPFFQKKIYKSKHPLWSGYYIPYLLSPELLC